MRSRSALGDYGPLSRIRPHPRLLFSAWSGSESRCSLNTCGYGANHCGKFLREHSPRHQLSLRIFQPNGARHIRQLTLNCRQYRNQIRHSPHGKRFVPPRHPVQTRKIDARKSCGRRTSIRRGIRSRDPLLPGIGEPSRGKFDADGSSRERPRSPATLTA